MVPSGIALLAFALSGVVLWTNRRLLSEGRAFTLAAWSSALFCAAGMTGMIAYDVCLDWSLAQFDTDGDGVFSPREQTFAQREAMDRVVNGLARTLLIGVYWPLISLGYLAFLYMIMKIYDRLSNR